VLAREDPANITPAVAAAKSIFIFILYLHFKVIHKT
jgi:hypothetical protein